MERFNLNDRLKYTLIPREREDHCDGPFEECARCGFPAPLRDFAYHGASEPRFLCSICADVQPCAEQDAVRLQRTICYVGNAILSALGVFKEENE